VGIEPSLEQVPQLPVRGDQQNVLVQPRLAEGAASANLQSVGQLLATAGSGRAEGASWWWPQEEAAGSSRLSYVSVGNGFPPLAKRLVERIQALEFVDMADLRPAQWQEVLDPEPDPRRFVILPGLEVARAKKKSVEDIRTWTMCFTIYTAAVGIKHPEMMPEMLAYMLHILRSHREYEEPAWREYDVRFRQMVAVTGNKAWSQLDPQLFNQCFVGRARRVASPPQQGDSGGKLAKVERENKMKPEICYRYNREGSCPYNLKCRFQHKCALCGGRHSSADCKKGTAKQ